jgi:hypothetical protein
VHKLGDRWRAELAIGTQRLVITGLAGARIPVTTLAVGRRAVVVGLARRPYPGATDRRWSVVPRNPADVVVTAAAGGGPEGGSGGQAATVPLSAGSAEDDRSAPLDVDLVSLAEHVGRTVRVGGLVSTLVEDGFLLDDGTAVGRIRLGGSASEYHALLEEGDAVNATGRVAAEGGEFLIVVEEAAGLVRAGDPDMGAGDTAADVGAQTSSGDTGDADQPAASAGSAGATRVAGGLLGGALPEAAGVLGLVLATVASLGVTTLRRHRSRRLLARRIAARLATFGGTGASQA